MKSRKNTFECVKSSSKYAGAATSIQNKVFDEYLADDAYLKLVHENRYDRDAVTKATAINNKDYDRSLAWLQDKGYEPIPELTAEKKHEKARINTISHKGSRQKGNFKK